jgi:exodeoxyribonuclease-3
LTQSKSISIASWNVNGIRACHKKGFLDWLNRSRFDVVLLQEVRAELGQIPKPILDERSYNKFWFPATCRKGYSGVAIFSRREPIRTVHGIKSEEFDTEGRVLTAEFEDLYVVSAYFPNSQDGGRRIGYKIRFCETMHAYLKRLRKRGKPVVLGGDFNIAPYPIDLARPKENEGNPGYLPEERDWMDSFLRSGWIDTYRYLHPDVVKYSWWSMRSRARERNIGWRLDFHTVAKRDHDRIASAAIHTEGEGSDHCPVSLKFLIK